MGCAPPETRVLVHACVGHCARLSRALRTRPSSRVPTPRVYRAHALESTAEWWCRHGANVPDEGCGRRSLLLRFAQWRGASSRLIAAHRRPERRPFMDLGIAGKVALVTGGARNLGRADALKLADE